MKGFSNRLNQIEEYILMITFPLMLLFVFSATISRYFQIGSLTWAEEAARYLMIWLAFAGISLGFKKNAHLGLSFFVNRFSYLGQKILYFVRAILILVFGVLISYYTALIIINQMSNPQLSPSMGIPIWWVYLAILFGSIMIILRTIQMVVVAVKEDEFTSQVKEEAEV